MNSTDYLQLARGLAGVAVRAQTPETEKVAAVAADLGKQANIDIRQLAANPYVQNALLGVGAGSLIGLVQPKNKRRAALNYALMGGLGGLGVTAARQFSAGATPPPAVAQAKHDGSLLNATIGLGGAGAGAYGGHRAHGLLDQWGKLDRLVDAKPDMAKHLSPVIDKMRNAGKSQAEIVEALSRKGVARKVPAAEFRSAYQKLPAVRGRYALPIAGALAVPTLINSLRGAAASE